jgi:glucosamine-6-phosphate deaminase
MSRILFGEMDVVVAESTESMGALAAGHFAAAALDLLRSVPEINVIFSGAESQQPFHRALVREPGIPWQRINAFGVDEFYAPGLPPESAVSAQPRRDLYRHVPLKSVNVIDFAPADPEGERRRYERLIREHPPHICCLGVGLSGHIALNEPGATSFEDRQSVRLVTVTEESKHQLSLDPNFRALPAIPDRGLTVTIPVLIRAPVILVVVPFALKADIIAKLARAPVSPELPASILKTLPTARLYLDPESASGLPLL